MLELYHNAVSTCSQKIRLVMAHKELEFESREIDLVYGGQHDPACVRLNPNHVVPTLVNDGNVLIESTLINEYLDETFSDNAVPNPASRAIRRSDLEHGVKAPGFVCRVISHKRRGGMGSCRAAD